MAGLRAEELCQADIGDIRTTDDGAAVIHVKGNGVKGNGGKERGVPIEAVLLSVIETYLESRANRLPGATKRKADVAGSALSGVSLATERIWSLRPVRNSGRR